MPPYHVSLDNLAGTRIDHRGPHGVRLLRRRVGNDRITNIINVEIFITFRDILRDNSVFETGCLECGLPIQYSCFNLLPPLFGGRGIDIKHDRFNRLYHLSSTIFLYIFRFRFQPPAVNELPFLYFLLNIIKISMFRREKTYTVISETRLHRFLRQ